jgi:sterol desaturase/sphingolipid hydroxylase (fatty acid hydroxylase superfamily)
MLSLAPLFDTLEARLGPFWTIAAGTVIWHELFFLALNLPYLVAADRGWWERWRIQSKGKRTTSAERWATLRVLLWDHLTQLAPLTVVGTPIFLYVGIETSAASLPSWATFLAQFLIFNVLEDVLFYTVHRILHTPALYKRIHHKHHQFLAPYSLAGEVAHPVEFLFNFLLPLVAGPLLLPLLGHPVHIASFWAWIFFREARGVDAHSGYALPFHPLRLLWPIYPGPRHHDHHHSLKGRQTNFGGYIFLDALLGTLEWKGF